MTPKPWPDPLRAHRKALVEALETVEMSDLLSGAGLPAATFDLRGTARVVATRTLDDLMRREGPDALRAVLRELALLKPQFEAEVAGWLQLLPGGSVPEEDAAPPAAAPAEGNRSPTAPRAARERLAPSQSPPAKSAPRVFVSYKRGDHEEDVRALVAWMRTTKIDVHIDEEALNYKDSISEFVHELGHSDAIVALIGPGYLKSSWCMRELLSIYQQADGRDRIFPLFLPGTPIFKLRDRLKIADYWKTEFETVKGYVDRGVQLSPNDRAEYERMLAFALRVGEMTEFLQDMVLLNAAKLDVVSLETLKEALVERFRGLGHSEA